MALPRPQRPRGVPRLPQDAEVPAGVLERLASQYPLTVIRGPRGYGKTSALLRWFDTSADRPRTVYAALTTASNDGAGFWDELAAVLVGAGLLESSTHAHTGVSQLLRTCAEPLLLVIDDMHEAGLHHEPAEIDDELVDLLKHNERFFLVVAGRTLRPLETTGTLSVDAVVIGPDDLRLTGDGVFRLAQRLGAHITKDEAQQVAVELGGWPSAVRAGLVRSNGNGGPVTIDRDTVEHYVATMVRDLRFEKVRAFLLRTAIPDDFDLDIAREIVTEGNIARLLRNVLMAGLITERGTVAGPRYSYAPAIRSALRRMVREHHPQLEVEVHHALMRHAERRQVPAQVLEHAARAGEWERALDVLEQDWDRLLMEEPLLLGRVARMFPAPLVAENARLRVAVEHLDADVVPDQRHSWRRTVDSPTLHAEVLWQHAGLLGPGREGRDESTVQLVLLEWGVASTLQGDLDVALYAFSQARAVALLDHSNAHAARLGATGLALVHAVLGEVSTARRWLAELDSDDVQDDGVVAETAAVARALASVDEASEDAAERVADLPERRHRDELWALTIFVRAHHAVLVGARDQIVSVTNELRAAVRYLRRGSRAEVFLTEALVEALLRVGISDVAQQVAARVEPPELICVSHMKIALDEHAYDEVIRQGAEALRSGALTQRYTMECYVLLAAAHHAIRQTSRAAEAFSAAVGLARETGQRRPFLLMGRAAFLALAAGDPDELALWPGSRTATSAPPSAVVDGLTFREAQVLGALAEHSGAVGIAHELGLSVNTVKTHLRAVYKKLGASNRGEALLALRRGTAP
ncbi:LuxR C-terminal-related transcriptional regulator [Ruania suaedae]|uniref:LuxR C-terminal-related transcriptional regulator n=1 Tax=Ruania suaedae TaxID=2897774 RepID=UPI001E5D42C5|nr:LuxR C-terminal-related transcriptional regulator [Ruania suaedae]UFU02415.1 LuxR C-terminal-related transcriptional regulator [Ruania suaedae]